MAYDGTMTDTANTTATAEIELPGFATESNGTIRVFSDPILALQTFVIAPIADREGIKGEQVEEDYDLDLIFSATVSYDSINGREGFRVREDMTEDRFFAIVEDSPADFEEDGDGPISSLLFG